MGAKVNLIQLRKELSNQEATVIMPRMKEILNSKFVTEKQKLLESFEQHQVTKELENGPDAKSNIVKTTNGGNLYSLLGFVSSVDPVTEVRDLLDSGITKGVVTKQQKTKTKLEYNLEVRIPSSQEIKRRTSLLVWTTRSFIDLIENGIDNFRRYLFDDSGRLTKYSRSGTAIQIKNDIKKGRSAKIKGIPYVSKLIEDFKKNLRKFNNK